MKLQSSSNRPMVILSILLLLGASQAGMADTMYWTNSSTAGNFTNTAMWIGGVVPGAGDTAYFTNSATDPTVNWTADATTADADFSTLGRTVTLNIGNWTWYVTDQFVVSADAGRTNTVTLSTGTLIVTNASGTGTLSVGAADKATFNMNGGSVRTDRLLAYGGAVTNATLMFKAGALTTYHGATATNVVVTVGATAGSAMTWNMTGGTNLFDGGSVTLANNAGQTGIVTVAVTGTQLTLTNIAIVTVGGNITGNGQFTVSNNATAVVGPGVTVNVNGYGSAINIAAGGAMTILGSLNVGSGASDTNDSVWVTGVNSTLTVTNFITIGSAGKFNQLVVSNGASLWGGGANELRVGYSANGVVLSNRVVVTGPGSTLTNFGVITLGQQNGGNRFEVTEGGQVFNTNGTIALGNNAPASNNTVLIAGANSAWWTKSVGIAGGWGNQVLVTNGGLLVSPLGGTLGINGSSSNLVLVASGGVWSNANGTINLGHSTPSFLNQILISGAGRVYSKGCNIGNGAGNSNSVVVTDPGSIWTASGGNLIVGNNIGDFNSLMVSNGGAVAADSVTVGNIATASNNTVVVDGGLLEAGISLKANANSSVGNSVNCLGGGVYQFTSATPTINPYGFGSIAISNGAISFRAVTNADVFCNQSGMKLDSTQWMAWAGANTFRLNNATNNAATANQTYTFAPDRGATNYTRLELINNARYMKGTATIGNGGSLMVSNGVNTITNLTLQSGATLQVALTPGASAPLTVEGALQLGNGTLAVTLNGAPTAGTTYPVVSNVLAQVGIGSFINASVMATFANTNYTLSVQTDAGAGGGARLRYNGPPTGTIMILR